MSFAILLIWAALAAGGCGSLGPEEQDLPRQDAALLLDAPPSGVHAGIYMAAERGFDQGEGVTLRIRRPSSDESADALRRLDSERVDAALLSIHELGRAREAEADVVGVMALVQRPLAAVLAAPAIDSPAGLVGRDVGVSGAPADGAVLRSIVRGDGGDVDGVRTVPVRGNPVEALESGRVSGVVGDRSVAGVAVRAASPRAGIFAVEDFGAPAYPELVLVVSRRTLEERRSTVRAVIRALQRGYREAQIDPESAATVMTSSVPTISREVVAAQIDAVAPAWTAGARAFGELRPDVLREWARWALAYDVLRRRPDLGRAFATDLVSRPRAP